ncbi:NUCLEOSOME/CHROMATIN ASSEMBLY FACTOR GROUP A 02, nucleosome assembly protein 1;2 [Hibiscus trionum]|uniref:NUCLEOSOME/CHROMATIN ASSEMBLY FACTOR GROUP A 02, nucleosome assembly protein 12 n=1 Tax=Hibiscus trionum TaxID=183268 RepID=A0A9W7M6F7_HIBTR|nr:NUCLEOSOME/CHROMATIN ASSEMBLY FACTOR GROUP A 02, nucleosome assembly protein 1;2 [Hibiscus trionum]
MSNAGLNEEAQTGLVSDLKNKLEVISPNVRKRVEFLIEIQGRHDEVEAKFFEEKAALEAKYQKLYQPLYAKRYNIVNGVGAAERTTNDMDMDLNEDTATEEKGVPHFWLIAMKNNEVLSEEITELDEGALKYLKDIKWHRMEEPKGFKLEFYFDTNPYFKNTLLTKTYYMIDEYEHILEKSIGTEIEWYPGKCLTQKTAKAITKTEDCQSFFNFLNPPQVPDDEKDTAEELQSLMEHDYDIGSTIREKIIPHAVSWFTGEAIPGYELDTDDDDDDYDGYDDDDEEDDEDSDSEEDEEERMRMRKKRGRAQGGGQQGEKPPSCKQQ